MRNGGGGAELGPDRREIMQGILSLFGQEVGALSLSLSLSLSVLLSVSFLFLLSLFLSLSFCLPVSLSLSLSPFFSFPFFPLWS